MTESKPSPAAGPRFVHLKVHSAYSLLEGALPIGTLYKLADKLGMPALALTDTDNLFGALEFSDKVAAAGVQPIVGVSLAIDFADGKKPAGILAGTPQPTPAGADGRLALLASNEAGYANLMKLVSAAHLGVRDGDSPHVTLANLLAHAEGVIVLSGGQDGPIDRPLIEGRAEVSRTRLKRLAERFGDRLYVELQRHGTPAEAMAEPALIDLAYELALPLVATNECYFAKPDDYEAHDALLCIAGGRFVSEDDRRRVTKEHYFKSAAEMTALFADLPEALDNTIEIAKRCAYRPRGRKPILPSFVATQEGASVEDKLAAEAAELKRQAESGLDARLAVLPIADGFTRADYDRRLAYEIDVITKMKFPGYFLIVADFIKWSKAQGIPVGPGRGSGAGSLVAWSLTITDLDPLRFGLLFERFLNPERISMPDFDIDFCQDRREETIHYVQQKYGTDRVAQIITHGKLQARAVLRDVGRVLQMPFGQISKLCALVPNNPANPVTLKQAIDGEPKLQAERDGDAGVKHLLAMCEKLEGLYRHASTHAAGIVIGDRPLDELVPMYRDPKSSTPVTQFNWKMVEAAGLVKFDFLGLKTLTVLKKAVDLIESVRGETVDLTTLAIGGDDPKVKGAYELLARADTVGVFQLESTGMRDSLKRLKPDRFEDIIAMVALYRPGPMDNIPTYINRKHGEEEVDCLHPMLEGILKETYGVIIYQEQVIQIAQVMGGYTLGQADLLRRAMGKKDKDEMARQQARFVEGAKKNGVKEKDAVYIFQLVDKFAGYGFNKSHAAAYALVSYHTAYLKANYRAEFLAASMTLDMSNTDKLAMFAAEARKSGIAVRPPCVNASGVDFGVEYFPSPRPSRGEGARRADEGRTQAPAQAAAPHPASGHPLPIAKGDGERENEYAIRYSLAALKNIGAGAVETIVTEREHNGPYKSLADFAQRFSPKALNKRALETMAAGGAFDAFEANRAAIHGNVDLLLATAARSAENAASGTTDMFAGGGSEPAKLDLRPVKAWTPMDKLNEEFKAIGFFLSGHPLDSYASILPKLGVMRFAEFEPKVGLGVSAGKLAAIVVSARERRSQKGNKFAFAMFSDATGQFEAIVFSDTLNACGHLLEAGMPVLVSVEAEREGDTVKMRVQGLQALDEAAAGIQRGLKLVLDRRLLAADKISLDDLKSELKAPTGGPRSGGEIRVVLDLDDRDRTIEFDIPGRWDVGPMMQGHLGTVRGVLDVIEL